MRRVMPVHPGCGTGSSQAPRKTPGRRRHRTALRSLVAGLFFAATAFTTTAMGASMAGHGDLLERPFAIYAEVLRSPRVLLDGLPFSLPLIAFLLAHESGHWIACRRRGLDAGPPFFLPAPNLIGTFGAFLRVRSPLRSRGEVVEVGAAGPLLGLAVCLPLLVAGVRQAVVVGVPTGFSRACLGPADLPLGRPVLLRLVVHVVHGPLAPGTALRLGPAGVAAWFGLLVTTLNLFPAGQLDGGHVVYGLAPRWHRTVSWIVFGVAVGLGLLAWVGWFVWSAVIAVMRGRHPPVPEPSPPSARARVAGILCLLAFPLCVAPVPLRLEVPRVSLPGGGDPHAPLAVHVHRNRAEPVRAKDDGVRSPEPLDDLGLRMTPWVVQAHRDEDGPGVDRPDEGRGARGAAAVVARLQDGRPFDSVPYEFSLAPRLQIAGEEDPRPASSHSDPQDEGCVVVLQRRRPWRPQDLHPEAARLQEVAFLQVPYRHPPSRRLPGRILPARARPVPEGPPDRPDLERP